MIKIVRCVLLTGSTLFAACASSFIFESVTLFQSACIASVAMLPLMLAYCRAGQAGGQFVASAAGNIDRLMIGSAEMSYFMDSVKKKSRKK